MPHLPHPHSQIVFRRSTSLQHVDNVAGFEESMTQFRFHLVPLREVPMSLEVSCHFQLITKPSDAPLVWCLYLRLELSTIVVVTAAIDIRRSKHLRSTQSPCLHDSAPKSKREPVVSAFKFRVKVLYCHPGPHKRPTLRLSEI